MALAAAAAQAHPSPPPPPPPKARRTVSCVFFAWTATICLSVASMWIFSWSLAAAEIGWLACGASRVVITAAFKVFIYAGATFLLVAPFSLLGAWMMARPQAGAAVVPVPAKAAAAATDVEATKEPALTLKTCFVAMWGGLRALTDLKTCYAGMRRALRDPLTLGFLASFLFTLLVIIALRVVEDDKTVMGSRRAITCLVIYHVGAVGMNAVDCFVLCPLITLRVWRFWRKARHAL